MAAGSQLLMTRGEALTREGRLQEALACYRKAIADEAVRYTALVNAAQLEATLRRHRQALELLDQAVAFQPEAPLAYYRRSIMRLLFRDFAGGFADYEYRLQGDMPRPFNTAVTPQVQSLIKAAPSRVDLAGRRVLLIGEQGLGDEVMFASMIPDLAAIAAGVTCACERRLARLFANSFEGVEVVGVPGSVVRLSNFDILVAMGSLGQLFRNRPEDFPATPFLKPRDEVVERWRDRLGPRRKRLRVGLSWRGGVPESGGARRSVPLERLVRGAGLEGCDLVSLQYGEAQAEIEAANRLLPNPVLAFPPAEIDDYEELAGLVQNLDLVVSVQTALVHLCGGLGKTCLTLMPVLPEWRYTLTGETMPWYGSVSLFRQERPGDWAPVLRRIGETLRAQ